MSKVIYKYKLTIGILNEIEIPEGSQILDVQTQGREISMWVIVNTNNNMEKRIFETVLTGVAMSIIGQTRIHLGTCQLHDGSLVIHVFERISPINCVDC